MVRERKEASPPLTSHRVQPDSSAATGVTSGSLVAGIKRRQTYVETETILMRSKTGSLRRIHYRQRNQ